MRNSEGRQEATGTHPDGLRSSYAPAAPALDQLRYSTIAGNSRHTVNEPRTPEESSAAVVSGQVTRQAQSAQSLIGNCKELFSVAVGCDMGGGSGLNRGSLGMEKLYCPMWYYSTWKD